MGVGKVRDQGGRRGSQLKGQFITPAREKEKERELSKADQKDLKGGR